MTKNLTLMFAIIFLYGCTTNDPIIIGYYKGPSYKILEQQSLESQYIIVYNDNDIIDYDEGQKYLNDIVRKFSTRHTMVFVKSVSQIHTGSDKKYKHIIHYMIILKSYYLEN